ncbi:MAG: cupin domain-containing protein [Pseudohongiellaceae bacterium]
MTKLKSTLLLGTVILLLPVYFAAEPDPGFVIMQLDDMQWDESSDRVQSHILHGNPSEEGLYIMRVRFPDGGSSSPHYHTQDRFITVIEGTWHAGTDASHDMSRTTPIPAGGFMMHPAGAVHYDGSRGGAVVVEIRGMGPVETVRVEASQ